jgi:hypothetical protein
MMHLSGFQLTLGDETGAVFTVGLLVRAMIDGDIKCLAVTSSERGRWHIQITARFASFLVHSRFQGAANLVRTGATSWMQLPGVATHYSVWQRMRSVIVSGKSWRHCVIMFGGLH